MSRALRAEIDLSAVVHNYRAAKQLAPQTRAVAVIKADAYGHGAVAVAKALAGEADAFAVCTFEEAAVLREAGIRQPLVLLEGTFSADDWQQVEALNLWPALHSLHQVEQFEAAQLSKPVPLWLKLDTGMHRLGFSPDELPAIAQRLRDSGKVSDLTLMSHLACADEPQRPETAAQIELFDQVAGAVDFDSQSLANSAAVLAWPQAHRDWSRPGLMLYGASPFVESQPLAVELKPAMRLVSEVLAVRELPEGAAVGYGGGWVCDKPTRVGVVAVGYGDGYPRQAQNGTPICVAGVRTRIIGRVSMDMITIDLTGIDQAEVGSEVEIWGPNLPAEEVAAWCGTISYTLMTGLTPRVPRVYL